MRWSDVSPLVPSEVEARSRLGSARAGLLALGLFCTSPAHADSNLPPAPYANRQLLDAHQEAAAKDLMEEVRCLVCSGQSIADSNAELAGDMRSLIRTRIAAGESPDTVRAFLIERYGEWVTYKPPLDGLTWPLYVLPAVLVGLGLLLARGRFRKGRNA